MEVEQPQPEAPAIAQIVSTARQLRAIRAASRRFLMLWAMEQAAARAHGATDTTDAAIQAAIADPKDHDWSILYRGSVLDD